MLAPRLCQAALSAKIDLRVCEMLGYTVWATQLYVCGAPTCSKDLGGRAWCLLVHDVVALPVCVHAPRQDPKHFVAASGSPHARHNSLAPWNQLEKPFSRYQRGHLRVQLLHEALLSAEGDCIAFTDPCGETLIVRLLICRCLDAALCTRSLKRWFVSRLVRHTDLIRPLVSAANLLSIYNRANLQAQLLHEASLAVGPESVCMAFIGLCGEWAVDVGALMRPSAPGA